MPHRKIHAEIKKHAPRAFHSSKRKFRFKYPKTFFLILSIILAYFLFSNPFIFSSISRLGQMNIYLGSFVAGILIAFGFSSAFGIGLLIALQPSNIFLATLFGGIGAAISDFILFKTIKLSFEDEFNELKRAKVIRKIHLIVSLHKHVLLRHYLLYALAGIIIVTPLPDEVGVTMLAGLTTIKQNVLLVVSFILHASIIFLLFSAF